MTRKEPRARKPKTEGKTATAPKAEKSAVETQAAAAPAPVPPPAVTPPVQTYSNRFKLGPDKFVLFDLPPSGFTVSDWKRLLAHMLTLCDDFDPEHSPQVPGFAMVRGTE